MFDKRFSELKKYLYRFGFVLLTVVGIMYFTQGPNALKVGANKTCMLIWSVGLCELVWVIFFKPVVGKVESLDDNNFKTVMYFRGLLYGAIILGFCLGL